MILNEYDVKLIIMDNKAGRAVGKVKVT